MDGIAKSGARKSYLNACQQNGIKPEEGYEDWSVRRLKKATWKIRPKRHAGAKL